MPDLDAGRESLFAARRYHEGHGTAASHPNCPVCRGDWRESQDVQDARTMLRDLYSPLWPGLTEDEWAKTLRGVLAERDFLGEWLQRLLDAEYERDRAT